MIVSASIFQGFIISPDLIVAISAPHLGYLVKNLFHCPKQDISAPLLLAALEMGAAANYCTQEYSSS